MQMEIREKRGGNRMQMGLWGGEREKKEKRKEPIFPADISPSPLSLEKEKGKKKYLRIHHSPPPLFPAPALRK